MVSIRISIHPILDTEKTRFEPKYARWGRAFPGTWPHPHLSIFPISNSRMGLSLPATG